MKHRLEYIALRLIMGLFGLLPYSWASAFGGFLARVIGPFTKANKTAKHNLQLCLPSHDGCTKQIWDNLGRTAAELPHLRKFKAEDITKNITIEGEDILDAATKEGAIFVSAHLANWEIIPRLAAWRDTKSLMIYRAANNKLSDNYINKLRAHQMLEFATKSRAGMVKAVKYLKAGDSIGLLMDQKLNNGIECSFFGHKAMTTSSPAELAAKFNKPIVPIFIRRDEGCKTKFIIKVYEPIKVAQDEVIKTTQHLNDLLQDWVSKYPNNWFWVHNRFSK